MMYLASKTLLCLVQLVITVFGQSSKRVFVNPPPATNPARVAGSFIVGSSLRIAWSTKGTSLNLFMHQLLPNGTASGLQYLPNSIGLQSTTEYLWKIDLSGTGGNPNFDLDESPTFYFAIVEAGETTISTFSQVVNFTTNVFIPSNTARTTLSSPKISPTGGVGSTNSSATSTTKSVSSVSSIPTSGLSLQPSKSNEGLSSTTKTGIGIGIGVGVLALIAGFGFGYWFFGRKKAAPLETLSEQTFIKSPPAINSDVQQIPGAVPLDPKQYERAELQ
ncbi:hypothetical protein VTL71DRAFT_5580 [Oculimacula yallundae]|uniref:Mid2 domain-containing protein n=1 Tax=Oculimacula yallundae TaxID=86028 RepID=A0ABR4C237_9HELO